jgi:hypothetical protein
MAESRHPGARGVAARLLGFVRRRSDPAAAPDTSERCRVCGEATMVGSVLYPDRVVVVQPDGSRAFLCAECDARARRAAMDRPPADADLDTIADNGVMVGANLLGGGGP